MSAASVGVSAARSATRDGRAWRIGEDREVAWVREGTTAGYAITAAIPPVFGAYATVELPTADELARARHTVALLGLLVAHTPAQPWWLGYLHTGAAAVVFDGAPTVTLHSGWRYVLIEAGPDEAARWRDERAAKGALPDLMFPADRSWLASTLWDDDWTCLGAERALIDGLLAEPELGARAREVGPADADATPPGHVAF